MEYLESEKQSLKKYINSKLELNLSFALRTWFKSSGFMIIKVPSF